MGSKRKEGRAVMGLLIFFGVMWFLYRVAYSGWRMGRRRKGKRNYYRRRRR